MSIIKEVPKDWSEQQIFDFVAAHLFEQGKPSSNEEYCLYRTKEGLACAIGCLIPDSFYDKQFEGFSIEGETFFKSANPELLAFVLPNQRLLKMLQTAHDTWYEQYKKRNNGNNKLLTLHSLLCVVASDFYLSTKNLDSLLEKQQVISNKCEE